MGCTNGKSKRSDEDGVVDSTSHNHNPLEHPSFSSSCSPTPVEASNTSHRLFAHKDSSDCSDNDEEEEEEKEDIPNIDRPRRQSSDDDEEDDKLGMVLIATLSPPQPPVMPTTTSPPAPRPLLNILSNSPPTTATSPIQANDFIINLHLNRRVPTAKHMYASTTTTTTDNDLSKFKLSADDDDDEDDNESRRASTLMEDDESTTILDQSITLFSRTDSICSSSSMVLQHTVAAAVSEDQHHYHQQHHHHSIANWSDSGSDVMSDDTDVPDPEKLSITTELVRGFDAEGNKLLNEYSVIGLIGKGAFGKVKLAVDTLTDKSVAIKILNMEKLRKDDVRRLTSAEYLKEGSSPTSVPQSMKDLLSGLSPLQLVHQEIDIMKRCRHPNLVKLINVIQDPNVTKLYLVMEYMENGIIAKSPSLHRPPPLPTSVDTQRFRKMFLDVLHGLQFLHHKGVIHMDIKPENILIAKDGSCKLADFGVCTVLGDNVEMNHHHHHHNHNHEDLIHTRQGTPVFFAPEMIADSRSSFHGKATDVWALGVTMYCVVYGRFPFEGPEMVDYNDNVQNVDPTFPSVPGVTDALIDVIRRTLEKEPSLRITVGQLVRHPFFVGGEGGGEGSHDHPKGVPLRWWVRCWKETKIAQCTDETERQRLFSLLASNVGGGDEEEGESVVSNHKQQTMTTRVKQSPKCSAELVSKRMSFFEHSAILSQSFKL